MNIFKALVSGKKPFLEENASSLLAWLMNPYMEHGLGFGFLKLFITRLAESNEISEDIKGKLRNLAEALKSRLRSGDINEIEISTHLEYSVDNSFIDIVLELGDGWILAIENKVRNEAASNSLQIYKQYEGLKKDVKSNNYKIGMIFLIPCDEDMEILDGRIANEYDALTDMGHDDFKAIYTWQSNHMKYPSIYAVITELLNQDVTGEIEPMTEYMRHTLKALNYFIRSQFDGYEFKRISSSSGLNPLTEGRKTLSELRSMDIGYVGVASGISGLLKLDNKNLRVKLFQYSRDGSLADKRNWMDLATFKEMTSWLSGEKAYPEILNKIDNSYFGAESIFKLASTFRDKLFVGIKGGRNALEHMNNEEIIGKRWQIKLKSTSNQWLSGSEFVEILQNKGIAF